MCCTKVKNTEMILSLKGSVREKRAGKLGGGKDVLGVSVEYKNRTMGNGFVWVGVSFGWVCPLSGRVLWVGVSAYTLECEYKCI